MKSAKNQQKQCKVCNFTRQKTYGLLVSSLNELKSKGCEQLEYNPRASVSVVLEDDGTIIEDEAYFLCLPMDTKFMLLREKETWSPLRRVDGGTSWMFVESDNAVETDGVRCSANDMEPWQDLAQQLKQDLSNIILMSEADLQSLVDVSRSRLASELCFTESKVQNLQEALQRVLDRREEVRQSKELLQLYLETVKREEAQQAEPSPPSQEAAAARDEPDAKGIDSAHGFMARTLMVLKGKTSPETRLSTAELQMVVSKGAAAMEPVLGWDREKTSGLLQACEAELSARLQQLQAVRSLGSLTPTPAAIDETLPKRFKKGKAE